MKAFIALVIVALVGVGAFMYFNKPAQAPVEQKTTETTQPATDNQKEMVMEPMVYKMAALKNSTESGMVSFEMTQDGKTQVKFDMINAAKGVAQPAHIHEGSCAKPGAVQYPLANLVDGASSTVIDISLDDLMKKMPFAVVVHKSEKEAGTYVSCGDIKTDNAMMMQDGKLIEGDGTTSTSTTAVQGSAKTFDITGKDYAFSTKEIKVKKGDKVTINFTSTDGFHDWVVDEFNARTTRVSTGGKTSVTFTADKTGTFEYYCSVGSHRAKGMKGNLIVE